MKITIRKAGSCKMCKIEHDDITLEFGLMNDAEFNKMANEFVGAAYDLIDDEVLEEELYKVLLGLGE